MESKSTAHLADLIRQLDGSKQLSLAQAEQLMNAYPVTANELFSFVKENPEKYNRAHVFKSDVLELLCLTWLPGQMTPIHGHGPSVGAVRVARGRLFERAYKIQDRRPVETDSRMIETGSLFLSTPGLIHQVGNASKETMVTLHLYSPPLPFPATQSFETAATSSPR